MSKSSIDIYTKDLSIRSMTQLIRGIWRVRWYGVHRVGTLYGCQQFVLLTRGFPISPTGLRDPQKRMYVFFRNGSALTSCRIGTGNEHHRDPFQRPSGEARSYALIIRGTRDERGNSGGGKIATTTDQVQHPTRGVPGHPSLASHVRPMSDTLATEN